MIRNRVGDWLVRIPNPLRVGTKTPINTGLFSSNFVRKTKNTLNPRLRLNLIIRRLLKQVERSSSKRRSLRIFPPILRVRTPLKAAHIDAQSRPSRLTVAGLRCRPPSIKVILIEFPSSLWSRRSKPHRKPTTMARENPNSGEPPHSAMARRHEREPAAPPAGANRPAIGSCPYDQD
jgi:hypothetical protein